MDEYSNLDNEVQRYLNLEDRYLDLPDPETLPEAYFDGMAWEQICNELDRLQEEAWKRAYYDYTWYAEWEANNG